VQRPKPIKRAHHPSRPACRQSRGEAAIPPALIIAGIIAVLILFKKARRIGLFAAAALLLWVIYFLWSH
jgi:hypothetical protein